jgi:hypothetical protein
MRNSGEVLNSILWMLRIPAPESLTHRPQQNGVLTDKSRKMLQSVNSYSFEYKMPFRFRQPLLPSSLANRFSYVEFDKPASGLWRFAFPWSVILLFFEVLFICPLLCRTNRPLKSGMSDNYSRQALSRDILYLIFASWRSAANRSWFFLVPWLTRYICVSSLLSDINKFRSCSSSFCGNKNKSIVQRFTVIGSKIE